MDIRRLRLREQVNDALDIPINFEGFSGELLHPHSRVHVELGCLMPHITVTAYDPLFYLHHGFVDKVFATWQLSDTPNQQKRQSFNQLTAGRVLEPFNNPTHNDFASITDRPNSETWYYKENLGYEFDTIQWSSNRRQECTQQVVEGGGDHNWNVICRNRTISDGLPNLRHRQTNKRGEVIVPRLEVRVYAAMVVPEHFTGKLPYKFCGNEKRCTNQTLYKFGSIDEPAEPNIPVTSKDFVIITDLQHDKLFIEDFVPSKAPKKMKWHKIKLNKKSEKIVTVPPFVVYIIELDDQEDIKVAHLPKSVKKSEYGDLLKGYQVKKYCDTIKVKKHTWKLGKNCKSKEK